MNFEHFFNVTIIDYKLLLYLLYCIYTFIFSIKILMKDNYIEINKY